MQVNTKQAQQIYKEALKDIKPTDYVIDAYCGIGALSCLAAQKVSSFFFYFISKNETKNEKKERKKGGEKRKKNREKGEKINKK